MCLSGKLWFGLYRVQLHPSGGNGTAQEMRDMQTYNEILYFFNCVQLTIKTYICQNTIKTYCVVCKTFVMPKQNK